MICSRKRWRSRQSRNATDNRRPPIPRVAGIYSTPVGTDGVSNATIESTKYNTNVHDVEYDLNFPRPIVAGGTGASTAADARIALNAAIATQSVTDYDAQVWMTGMFASAPGAISAPTATGPYSGNATILTGDNAYITLVATNNATGIAYIRQKQAGVWSPWVQAGASSYVAKTGDIMTGSLGMDNGTADSPDLSFLSAGFPVWHIDTTNGNLRCFTAGGVWLNITSTGDVSIPSGVGIGGNANIGGNAFAGNYVLNANNSMVGLTVAAPSSFAVANRAGANINAACEIHFEQVDATGMAGLISFWGYWDGHFNTTLLGRTQPNGGLTWGNPTNAVSTGYGCINAEAVFDDNVLLTCFGAQHAARGTVDLAQWDAVAPSGTHKLAHAFVELLKDFDPRNPQQYVERMLRDEALPGMPTTKDWQHGQQSLGEMHNRLWLAVELLASAFAGAVARIGDLEARQK